MRIDKSQLHFLVALLLIVGYIPSVMAAEIMMGPLDIPLVKYGYVAIMATWGSVASLLQKFARGEQLSTGGWRLMSANHILNANLAATLVFLLCEHFKVPLPLEAIAFTLGGYGGAKTMDSLYKRFIDTGNAALNKTMGLPPSASSPTDTPTQ
jgi:hypothetical protein